MPPPDRQADPSHRDVVGLDKEFDDRAPDLIAWVEWLLHPETHHLDRAIILDNGHRVEHAGDVARPVGSDPDGPLGPQQPQSPGNYPFESVIVGDDAASYVFGAKELTGHRFGDDSAIARIFTALDHAMWINDDKHQELIASWNELEKHWKGASRVTADDFLKKVDAFMVDMTRALLNLSQFTLGYAAIIVSARKNMDEVMHAFSCGAQNKINERAEANAQFARIVLASVLTGALTFAAAGGAAASLTAAVSGVAGDAIKDQGLTLKADKWRDFTDQYLKKQTDVLTDVGKQIAELHGKIRALHRHLDEMPKLPS